MNSEYTRLDRLHADSVTDQPPAPLCLFSTTVPSSKEQDVICCSSSLNVTSCSRKKTTATGEATSQPWKGADTDTFSPQITMKLSSSAHETKDHSTTPPSNAKSITDVLGSTFYPTKTHERAKPLRITKDPTEIKRTKIHGTTIYSKPVVTSGKDVSTHSTKTMPKDKQAEQTIQTTESVTHHPIEAITSLSSETATGTDRSVAVTTPAPLYPHHTATAVHSNSESTSSASHIEEKSSTSTSLLVDGTRTAPMEVGPMPYDVISHDDLDMLRHKALQAFRNTKKRSKNLGGSMSRHWIWILFILPSLVLFAYVVFVALRRQTYRRKRHRKPRFDDASLHTEERLAQWRAFGNKSNPPGQGEFAREKFTECGPLVLTKELKGDVKFHSTGGSVSEIAGVQFDDRLNEVVEIGSAVEVVPEDTRTHNTTEQRSTHKGNGASTAKVKKSGRKSKFSKEKLSLCETQELDKSGEAEKQKIKIRSAERAYTPKKTQGSKEKEA